MKRYRTLLICACLAVLAACSSANFAYNRAPGFIAGEFDDAFNLNGEQADLLDERLQAFFDWHRREELARYQALLERAALQAEDGFSAREFTEILNQVRVAWDRAKGQIIDEVGDLGATLNPAQIEHFREYLAESNEDYAAYLQLDAQDRRDYRAERSFDRLESWFGRFDNALEDRIFTRLRRLPNAYEAWQTYRTAQTEEVLRIISTSDDPGRVRSELRRLLLDRSHPIARAYEPTRQAYWTAYAAMLEEIDGWLSPEHRQHAAERLQKLARMVAKIEPRG